MDRIETSSLQFIKIEPRGHAVENKFWVLQDGVKKLVKPSNMNVDQDVMEALSSEILKRVNINSVDVTLGYDDILKKNCCLVSSFLTNEADTLYEMVDWENVIDLQKSFDQVFYRYSKLYKITQEELENLKKDYVRIIFGKCLTENLDSKLDNIGLIYNEANNQYRLPPSYDNGLSFRSYNSSANPSCFIGNQLFEINDIVNYIMDNYFEYVSDIIPLLNDLANNLKELLDNYDIGSKKQYILNYITEFSSIVKSKEKKL